MTLVCGNCETPFEVTQRRGHTHVSYCSEKCRRRAAHLRRTPEKKREYQLKYRYGVTPLEVELCVAGQGGRCAICRKMVDLVVDHDHQTGAFRGMLCKMCNLAIGYFGDDPDSLRAAVRYLS